MKTFTIPFLLICIVSSVFGQTPLENAGYLFEDKNYVDAATAYIHLVEKIRKPELKNEVYAKIGHAYYFMQDYKNAETWYKKAADGGYVNGDFFFRYGDVRMYNADYAAAVQLFEKAKAADSTLIRLADIRIKSSNNAAEKQEYPNVILHANVKELNTPMGEYGIGRMGDRLVITSTRVEPGGKTDKTSGQGFARLYYTSEQNGTWKVDGKLPESVNSVYNNGTFSYHEPTLTGYYTQCNGFDGKGGTCKIYATLYDPSADTWSKPEALT